MDLGELFAGAERRPGRVALEAPEDWMQGRTVYGGLSLALAHEAARRVSPDLPPLRSVQVSFIGPLAGRLEASAEVLRRGRSTAFVQVDVRSAENLGLRAVFMFTAPRASALDVEDAAVPDVPDPEGAPPAMRNAPGKFFAQNLDYRHARPKDAPPEPLLLRWARLNARDGLDPVLEVLAIADALPPAAFAMMATPVPISSATWLINLLSPAPATRDGWWLLRARAEQVRGGFSSQSMAIWNRDRQPIAVGMQSVAVFG